jgi:outer membrane protein assembly factor BamB
MELVWAHDLIDDVNATAAFDWGEDGRGYLYIGPSKDYSGTGNKGDLPIRKLDAQTGEVVWEKLINCGTYDGCAGGTMGSPLLGRAGTDMENLVIFSMARTPNAWDSVMYAIDKESGEVVWEYELTHYSWSSPVGVYTEDGKGYIFQVDNGGIGYLIEGTTGEVKATCELIEHVEASPVVYEDRVVIGTRFGMYLLDIN